MRSRRWLGMLMGILLLKSLSGFAAGREGRPVALGSIAAKGAVKIDNQPAPPGSAFFPGDVIATGKDSTAVMSFQSGLAATITENSEVALSRDANSTTLNLRQGALAIRTAGRQSTRVSVLGASVIVQGQAGFPAMCRIASMGRSAAVFADRGRVEIHGAGAPVILPPGKFAQLEAGRAQGGGGQQAGKVSHAIPEEVVQRQGVGAKNPLNVNDPVNWQDVVTTLRTGRVRIDLLEGSILNIGARSTMRIIRHDPQAQQTQVELTLGRLRGEVVKITKPGGSFQVQTQTAVIGVVGTVFMIHALQNLTRVFCVDGILSVQNLNPAVIGQVTLRAGEFTSVSRGVPPTGALRSASPRIQAEINQTNVGPPTAAQVGMPPPTGAAGNVLSTASSVTSAGTGATSAALSSVAVSRVGDAEESLTSASGTLQGAATSSNAALSAANTAASTAISVEAGFQTFLDIVSASEPGCGCR